MADQTTVHIGENSQEHVAHRLLHEVMLAEKKATGAASADGWTRVDRKYLLDTFGECLQAVKGHRKLVMS